MHIPITNIEEFFYKVRNCGFILENSQFFQFFWLNHVKLIKEYFKLGRNNIYEDYYFNRKFFWQQL